MKKFLSLLLICLCTPLAFAQTVYHVGSGAKQPAAFARWEVSAGIFRSSRSIRATQGNNLFFSHGDGSSLRALYHATPWLALGLEGEMLRSQHISEISGFRTRRAHALAKFNLTPNTQPAVYVLLGAGQSYHTFDYAFNWHETDHTGYLLNGIGLELRLYKFLFIGAEITFLHHLHSHMGTFARGAHRERTASLRASLRF